jgi:hypothetical protein
MYKNQIEFLLNMCIDDKGALTRWSAPHHKKQGVFCQSVSNKNESSHSQGISLLPTQ